MWFWGQESRLDWPRPCHGSGSPFALATSAKFPGGPYWGLEIREVLSDPVPDVAFSPVSPRFGGSEYSAMPELGVPGVPASPGGEYQYGIGRPVLRRTSSLDIGTFTGAADAGWTDSRRGTL
jgi:hypothetical protein